MVSYSSLFSFVLDSGKNVTVEKIGLKSPSLQNSDAIELILDDAHFIYTVNFFFIPAIIIFRSAVFT